MMFHTLFHLLMATSLSGPAYSRSLQPIEPVEIPPSIQQGMDLIYIDPEIAPAVRERDALLKEIGLTNKLGSAVDLLVPVNPFYTQLRRGLMQYRASWGRLPQLNIPSGPLLKSGTKGERVALLRERLGLSPSDSFDHQLAKAVREYQQVHGI